MGKAGSSSIQRWIARNAGALGERGIALLVVRPSRAGEQPGIDVVPYESGKVDSNAFRVAYESGLADRGALLDRLLGALAAAAEGDRTAVVSSEAMDHFFWDPDDELLTRLDALAERTPVRVAYYVRPQHTALEAAWRQWGFRSGLEPSEYLAGYARSLHYHDTYTAVSERAPRVSFEPRPFRHDLLDDGDPALDFARRFLRLPEPPPSPDVRWSNRGLSLEAANALRHAPKELFRYRGEPRIGMVKDILSGIDAAESEETVASRRLIRAYCRRTFEPDNVRLAEELGWGRESFVPHLEGDDAAAPDDLGALDDLWAPKASPMELASLYAAIGQAVAARSEQRGETRTRKGPGRRHENAEEALGAEQGDRAAPDAERVRPQRSLTSRLTRALRRAGLLGRRGRRAGG